MRLLEKGHGGFATIEGALATVSVLKDEFAKGAGAAGFELALIYSPNNSLLSDKVKSQLSVSEELEVDWYNKAYHLLLQNAQNGSAEAMYLVGTYYQTGLPPVDINEDNALFWKEKAFDAGYLFAGNDLYSIYSDNSSLFFSEDRAQVIFKVLEENNYRVVPRVN